MQTVSDILIDVRNYIHSDEFNAISRVNNRSFIRKRILTSPVLVVLILSLLRRSIACEVLSFTKEANMDTFCRSAITKARSKLRPEAFVNLNNFLMGKVYSSEGLSTWNDFIVAAVDGTTYLLPINCPALDDHFGAATNHTDCEVSLTRSSNLFDVQNNIIMDSILAPYKSSERNMLVQHIENLKENGLEEKVLKRLLLLLDRGYPSVPLMAYLLDQKVNFVMRCNGQFIKEVNEAVAAGETDTIINVKLDRLGNAKKMLRQWLPDVDTNQSITIRILVISLKNGDKEVLITSLTDSVRYPYSLFKKLYFKRWGIEEWYKLAKGHLEIERFSGKSVHAIKQDVGATVFSYNVQSLLALEAQKELDEKMKSRQCKHKQKLNRNVGVHLLKNEIIPALLNQEVDLQLFCKEIKEKMKVNPIPIRPGRSFDRRRKHSKCKYHMNLR